METGEEKSGVLKRRRDPLSDSDDNNQSAPETTDGQKRRRLGAAGQENRTPNQSSGRAVAVDANADTPTVALVQQLIRGREGSAPPALRCLSDSGGDKDHLLGEGEFNQRRERFKSLADPGSSASTPSPSSVRPLTRSSFVTVLQQKLTETKTQSSTQASRLRQVRDQELNQLQFKPISENPWLKRSSSDPPLTQEGGNAEWNEGSFIETSTPAAVQTSGEKTSSEATPASVELGNASGGVEEQETGAESQLSDTTITTTLELSFNEESSLCRSELRSISEWTVLQQTNEDVGDVPRLAEQDAAEEFSLGENEQTSASSCGEEIIEPSTDEDSRLWRYPHFKEPLGGTEEKEKGVENKSADVEMENLLEMQTGETSGPRMDGPELEACLSVDQDNSERCEKVGEAGGEEEVEKPDGGEEEIVKPDGGEEVVEKPEGGEEEEEVEKPEGGEEGIVKPDRGEEVVEKPEGGEEEVEKPEGGEEEEKPDGGEEVEKPEGGEEEVEEIEGGEEAQEMEEPEELEQEMEEPEGEQEMEEPKELEQEMEEPEGEQEMEEPKELEQEMEEPARGEQEMDELADGGGERGEMSGESKQTVTESSEKITFILGGEQIHSSNECVAESSLSDVDKSTSEQNTSTIIDQMFQEVLEYAEQMEEEQEEEEEEEEETEDRDSGIETFSAPKEEKKSEEEDQAPEEENNGEELLAFPASGILSPLGKAIEAAVTPLRLTVSQESSNPPSLLLSPEENEAPPPESAPLYSVDAYRTQRRNKPPSVLSVTPVAQRPARKPQTSLNSKERITALSEEAAKLQTVISQTLQALSCCTDEEHGRGSLEEAEAEKLLLVSCEKRSALLAEVSRLREERSSEYGGGGGEAAAEEAGDVSQQACRGTVTITNIQLPLKVEFICSSRGRAGRPSHYFFILIRYGPCNVVATPLATAADAQNGDTISFPTSITLKDIRSSFEIDVEVYSLSNTSGSSCSIDRAAPKSKVTPRKLLSTITRSSNTMTSVALPALGTRRSSTFSLVGSHKITLASLGQSKFPLDKMKLDGKIRRLLGDEFQEKVPFLSPLEGNIYLQLDSSSHSSVQHQGFLTMFSLVSGFGVWSRRYFVLDGCNLSYWNHPNDRETKDADGSLSLSSSPSQSVRTVQRESCARPFTFELVSSVQQQDEDSGGQDASQKRWFSADTKQEKQDWMEKLSQALLDFHTWNRPAAESNQSSGSSRNLRESSL